MLTWTQAEPQPSEGSLFPHWVLILLWLVDLFDIISTVGKGWQDVVRRLWQFKPGLKYNHVLWLHPWIYGPIYEGTAGRCFQQLKRPLFVPFLPLRGSFVPLSCAYTVWFKPVFLLTANFSFVVFCLLCSRQGGAARWCHWQWRSHRTVPGQNSWALLYITDSLLTQWVVI